MLAHVSTAHHLQYKLILLTTVFLTIWVVSWKDPSPTKLKCACMYVSPSVGLTHLTNPVSVCECTAADATETNRCHRAPRCARNERGRGCETACKEVEKVAGVRGGVCGCAGCGRGRLVCGRLWVARLGARRLDRFLAELILPGICHPWKAKCQPNELFHNLFIATFLLKVGKRTAISSFLCQPVLLFPDCSA